MRQQVKAYVAGQLAACTEADPDHPQEHFKVRLSRPVSYGFLRNTFCALYDGFCAESQPLSLWATSAGRCNYSKSHQLRPCSCGGCIGDSSAHPLHHALDSHQGPLILHFSRQHCHLRFHGCFKATGALSSHGARPALYVVRSLWPDRLSRKAGDKLLLSHFWQEFAHPQARFLHEKRYSLPPRLRRHFQPFFGAVNRASFKAIDGAMFVGTVSGANNLSFRSGPCFRRRM